MNQQIDEYKHFKQIFLEVLNTHAPIKRKLLIANQIPHMTKALRKTIMKWSKLENKYEKRRKVKTLFLVRNRRISAVNYIERAKKLLWKARFKECDW